MDIEPASFESLVFCEIIIESHDDYSEWGTVYTGFDDTKRLLVVSKYRNYSEPGKDSTNMSTCSDVRNVFCSILDFMASTGARFTAKRFSHAK